MQFGDSTSLGKGRYSKYILWLPHRKCMGNLSVMIAKIGLSRHSSKPISGMQIEKISKEVVVFKFLER